MATRMGAWITYGSPEFVGLGPKPGDGPSTRSKPMGHMVIVCYRPIAGKEADLLREVKAHVPTLRRLGLATARPALAMRASDGTIVEVFEWVSQAAVDAAHKHPEVLAMWGRFGACCTMGTLAGLPGAREMFPHFEPVEV